MQSMSMAHPKKCVAPGLALQILKFLCFCYGTYIAMVHPPEAQDFWCIQDLVKIGHTIQTGFEGPRL